MGFSKIPNNEAIKYTIVWKSYKTDNGLYLSKFEITLFDSALYNINIDSLIPFLKDPVYDWSANLILYAKFKKDATMLKIFDRFQWQEALKDKDIFYWSSLKH